MISVLKIKVNKDIFDEVKKIDNDVLETIFLEGLQRTKIKNLLEKYSKGLISFGRTAELAGISEDKLAMEAYALGLNPTYNNLTIQEELQ